MKKTAFFIFFIFCTTFSQAQKKKIASKSSAKSSALAKVDNLTAEVVKGNFYLFINNKTKKDTIEVKTIEPSNLPKDCVLKPFSAKGVPLYLLTWKEENTVKTELKTETRVTLYSDIYDVASKSKLFSNQQVTTNITEKVFLDRLKNASETQERVRREGFEFVLGADGDVIQKNKTQQNTFNFDSSTKKYIEAKSATPAVKKKK